MSEPAPKPKPNPAPATPGVFNPLDSFARRLGKALKKKPGGAASEPAAPAMASPAPIAPVAPPPPRNAAFDSFAGRLGNALKKTPAATAAAAEPVDVEAPPAKPLESAGPVGAGERDVKQGECISSIAEESGHFWKTIWDDPANSELRRVRIDPNVLLPGDRVHVPQRREKWAPGQTELRHRFRRRGEPALLRLTLKIDDVPLGNQAYTLEIDGRTQSGVTDADGKLVQPIPPNARHGRLTVGDEKWTYELQLGHIDPLENLAGVQKRLVNLGFNCGRTDGEWDEASGAALRAFQRSAGLAETGEPDDVSRQRLKEAHGS